MQILLESIPISYCNNSNSFMQSSFWAKFKSEFAWRHLAYKLTHYYLNVKNETNILLLLKYFRLGYYIVYSAQILELCCDEDYKKELILNLAEKLKTVLPKKCIFIRFDLAWKYTEEWKRGLFFIDGLIKSKVTIQAADTVILDLSKSEIELLKDMKSKWRYNIRYAFKNNVQVKLNGVEGIDEFYNMSLVTAKRDNIKIHNKEYFFKLFKVFQDFEASVDSVNKKLILFFAQIEGKSIAAAIVLFWGNRATYLYGASTDDYRNLMPTYAVQWEAIRVAKSLGCLEYDFYGIPPNDDLLHPMAGLYKFKTGFGGRIYRYPSCFDYPLSKALYRIFTIAESLRMFYLRDFLKLVKNFLARN